MNTLRFSIVGALLAILLVPASGGELTPLKIGERAPLFSLKNHDGKQVDLAAVCASSRYTVVMFIATECPVSNAYNERMAALATAYTPKNISFVGVNSNKAESVARIAEHSASSGFAFPVVKDSANIVADNYAAQVTPEIFVLDSTAHLRYHGRIDDDRKAKNITSQDLKNALEALLAGKPVPATETKAFGCSIKRAGM